MHRVSPARHGTPKGICHLQYSAWILLCAGIVSPDAVAEFATTINVPPQPSPDYIDTDTQLNLFASGQLSDDFVAGSFNGLSSNVELNVFGGAVGDNLTVNAGSTLNLFGGSVGDFGDAFSGGLVNVVGGDLGDFFDANGGGRVHIESGSVGIGFDAFSGSRVEFSGGTIGDDFNAKAGSSVSILGKRFFLGSDEITGTLVPGVPELISSRQLALSGNLADDTPFSLDLNSVDEPLQDYVDPLAMLTITLLHPADYDRNGSVDQGDYLLWKQQFGATGDHSADGNNDGVVNIADYTVWRDALSPTAMSTANASATSVPAPKSLTLISLSMALLLSQRREIGSGIVTSTSCHRLQELP